MVSCRSCITDLYPAVFSVEYVRITVLRTTVLHQEYRSRQYFLAIVWEMLFSQLIAPKRLCFLCFLEGEWLRKKVFKPLHPAVGQRTVGERKEKRKKRKRHNSCNVLWNDFVLFSCRGGGCNHQFGRDKYRKSKPFFRNRSCRSATLPSSDTASGSRSSGALPARRASCAGARRWPAHLDMALPFLLVIYSQAWKQAKLFGL